MDEQLQDDIIDLTGDSQSDNGRTLSADTSRASSPGVPDAPAHAPAPWLRLRGKKAGNQVVFQFTGGQGEQPFTTLEAFAKCEDGDIILNSCVHEWLIDHMQASPYVPGQALAQEVPPASEGWLVRRIDDAVDVDGVLYIRITWRTPHDAPQPLVDMMDFTYYPVEQFLDITPDYELFVRESLLRAMRAGLPEITAQEQQDMVMVDTVLTIEQGVIVHMPLHWAIVVGAATQGAVLPLM